MDEVLPQDFEGVGNNNRCVENSEEYQEIGRRSKYNDNGSKRIGPNGKY